MSSKKFALRPLAVGTLLLVAGASQAAITVITTSAAFATATSATGVDTYTGFSIVGPTPSPITRAAGSYTYTATASTSTFFGAGTTANPWLGTNLATDSILFNGFSPSIKAIGGNFFGSDILGAFAAGDVTLTATDSLGATSTQTITGATTSSFLGFVSDGTITSLTLASVQGASPLWPTADNLIMGQGAATVVPEPGVYAMLLAGLGFVGFMARRRQG